MAVARVKEALVALSVSSTGGVNGVVFSVEAVVVDAEHVAEVRNYVFSRNVFAASFMPASIVKASDVRRRTGGWATRKDDLIQFLDSAPVLTDAEFGKQLNKFVEDLEREFASVTFAFADMLVEPMLVNKLLISAGAYDLLYTRVGKFLSGRAVHAPSYVRGVMRVSPLGSERRASPDGNASVQLLHSMLELSPSRSVGKEALIAWDIETTGGGSAGKVFAIGVAVHENGVRGIATRHLFVRNIFNGIGAAAYVEAWARNKWDKRTWDEFWSKFLPVLDDLMKGAPEKNDVEFGQELSVFLRGLEDKYTHITHVFDTVLFDSGMIGQVLADASELDLSYRRNGSRVGVSALHTGSYFMGWDHVNPWDKSETLTRARTRKVADASASHNHKPDDDAEYILRRLLAV